MSDFKNLKLNRELIKDAINSFSENTKFIREEGPALDKKNYIIESDGKEVKIAIYFIKTGETTLNPKIGKNQEIGIEIAEYIKERTKYSDFANSNATFSIANISNEDFDFLIEYLQSTFSIQKNKKTGIGIQYCIYNSIGHDSYIIHRYNNGNTLFQGKPLKIFSEIYGFLIEITNLEDIITINEKVYSISINKDETKLELNSVLPYASKYIDDTNKKIFESCLILKKLEIDLPDYSSFVFGALRGLELYIKRILSDNGIITNRKTNFKDIFFESSKERYILTSSAEAKISCVKTREILNDCFSFYSVNRHSLFHSDPIPELSKIIENRSDADRIVVKTFELIERTYNEILQVE